MQLRLTKDEFTSISRQKRRKLKNYIRVELGTFKEQLSSMEEESKK